jgi:hypothetical protein
MSVPFLSICLQNFAKSAMLLPQNTFVNNSVCGFKNAEFDTDTESVIQLQFFVLSRKMGVGKKVSNTKKSKLA